jgi:hypothetical protein
MKKRVTLKRLFHRDRMRIGIFFDYDEKLKSAVRSIAGSLFSGSNRCFYVDDSEENLRIVIRALKDFAVVDITPLTRKESVSRISDVSKDIEQMTIPVPDDVKSSTGMNDEFFYQKTISKYSESTNNNGEKADVGRNYPLRLLCFLSESDGIGH